MLACFIIVCDSGKFGDGCMSDCHCFGGSPCHHKDGSCTPDLCAPGWWGHNCSIGMESLSDLSLLLVFKIRKHVHDLWFEQKY